MKKLWLILVLLATPVYANHNNANQNSTYLNTDTYQEIQNDIETKRYCESLVKKSYDDIYQPISNWIYRHMRGTGNKYGEGYLSTIKVLEYVEGTELRKWLTNRQDKFYWDTRELAWNDTIPHKLRRQGCRKMYEEYYQEVYVDFWEPLHEKYNLP